MMSKEFSLNNNLFWQIKENHLQKLWTVNIKVNWAFGHCIGMGTLISMNFIFLLCGDNGITYKHFNLIFGIIILNHSFNKKINHESFGPSYFKSQKKSSPKILSALMKTINEFQRVIYN